MKNRCSGIIGYQNFRKFHRIWPIIDNTHNTLRLYCFVYQQPVFAAV